MSVLLLECFKGFLVRLDHFLVVLGGVKLKILLLKLDEFLLEFDEMELGKGTERG